MQSVWEREHEVFKVAVMFGLEVKAPDSAVEKGQVVLGLHANCICWLKLHRKTDPSSINQSINDPSLDIKLIALSQNAALSTHYMHTSHNRGYKAAITSLRLKGYRSMDN